MLVWVFVSLIESHAAIKYVCAVFLLATTRKFAACFTGFGVLGFFQIVSRTVWAGSHSKTFKHFLLDNCCIFLSPKPLLLLGINLIYNLNLVNILSNKIKNSRGAEGTQHQFCLMLFCEYLGLYKERQFNFNKSIAN